MTRPQHAETGARGTAGQAALFAAIAAAVVGAIAGVLTAPWLATTAFEPQPVHAGAAAILLGLAVMAASASWILAVAAIWTAFVALRRGGDSRARRALLVAAPGAVAGASVILLVAVRFAIALTGGHSVAGYRRPPPDRLNSRRS